MPIIKALCFITGHDRDALSMCSARVLNDVIWQAILHIAVALLVWSFIFSTASNYLDKLHAFAIVFTATATVLALDKTLCQSKAKRGVQYYLLLPLRIAVSLAVGSVISFSASIAMQRANIDELKHQDYLKSQQFYFQTLEEKRKELDMSTTTAQQQLLSAQQLLLTSETNYQKELAELRMALVKEEAKAKSYQAKAFAEENDPAFGAKCLVKCEAAKGQLRIADQRIAELEARVNEVNGKIDQIQSKQIAMAQADDTAQKELSDARYQQLELQLKRDPRFVDKERLRSSLSQDFMYLKKLMNDPESGDAVKQISIGIALFFLIIELAATLHTVLKPRTEYDNAVNELEAYRTHKIQLSIQQRFALDDTNSEPQGLVEVNLAQPYPVTQIQRFTA